METNIIKLLNELTYQTYIMNRDQIWKHLSGLSMSEYIALNRISEFGRTSEIYYEKIYLKELAENMRLTIRQISKMAGSLRDRGLIIYYRFRAKTAGRKSENDKRLLRTSN